MCPVQQNFSFFSAARGLLARSAALLLFVIAAATAAAQQLEPVRYTLRFDDRQTHYIEVEAEFPTSGKNSVDLMMAVWTPGAYKIQDYPRFLEEIRASDLSGKPLGVTKTRKNRWRVETNGDKRIRFTYRVYCRQMSVHTNYVEQRYAILNGAPTFVTLLESNRGAVRRPHFVRLELPADWKLSHTGLPEAPDGRPHHYRAPDYGTLVDSPILAGDLQVHEFDIRGREHYLVNLGEGEIWDGPRSAEDVEKIAAEQIAFWKTVPYERYSFLNAITEAGGGLEHDNSTLMMTSRWATRSPKDYLNWLSLVSHEFFHTWNVKRLRPKPLAEFDYERENYTRSLWVAEGFTSYYSYLFLRRAGLANEKQLLDRLSEMITQVQTTPGRLVQPVAEASYDAWIKFYQRHENTANTTINYYSKGAVIGFLLDAKIRKLTGGAKSLDDVMRLAYERYADGGYTPAQFRGVISEAAGRNLDDWVRRATETTKELDYTEALEWFGLRFRPVNGGANDDKDHEDDEKDKAGSANQQKQEEDSRDGPAWLGVKTAVRGGRLLIREVQRDTPAYKAGLNVGDEILAIGDYRVAPQQLGQRLGKYRPGDELSLLIARREQLMRVAVTAGSRPGAKWRLEADPDATEEQNRRRERWQQSALNGGS